MMNQKAKTQYEQVQDALYDWIAAVLAEKGFSCAIVWEINRGVRPKEPFISLQMIGGSRCSFPWKSRVIKETGERKTLFDMRKTVSIHGWGERALERLDEIADSISADTYRAMLRKSGIVVNKITNVTLSAQDIANETETHGYFDIAVTYIRVVIEKVGWIENVGIQCDLPANSEIDIREENNGRN